MAKNRPDLGDIFRSILGNTNVYFQPPENKKLEYPCILYSFSNFDTTKADNIDYLRGRVYDVTLIDRNPDNVYVDKLQDLQYCKLDRVFKNDNLYHYAFTIIY